ncbi:PREDICTED: protein SSUH2 homolog [Nanorana parkeri]|uniref:protein SSUH2 homolog n=1 Tax=Nanorana parkeri TaxID=125878 RepID=UPI0008542730|nr:PREDICTED: protein SSUH2 homolog [Nanorana parkeri]
MGTPFEPNYLMNPDLERAPLLSESAYMSTSMTPSSYPPGDVASAPMMAPVIGADDPTAPPTGWPTLPGYEGMGTGECGGFLPPPDLGPVPGGVPMAADTNWTIPFISEDTARKALLDYADRKCCYSTSPAEQMDFRELRPYNTYRYRLETFTESRTCKWVTKPHTALRNVFGNLQNSVQEMPRSRSGKGRQFEDACNHCRGCGTATCTSCHSSKYQTCEGCSGRGQILNYIQLTVTWKNHIYEFIVEHNSEFPTDLFRKVNGEKVFRDEQLLLPPLVNFPAPTINQASQNSLQQHHSQFASSSRILRQGHTVEWLPLTKVEYTWKGNPHDYFVYGKENKVYTDNYPQKCCCCCCVVM